MAKYRQIGTAFWNNKYIASLSTDTRYFYLYCKTNDKINTAGYCQLPIEVMGIETGLDVPTIRAAIQQLEVDLKIKYADGYLVVKDGNDGQTSSPKVRTAVETQLAEAPAWVGEFVMRGTEDDERASHPAIIAVTEICERYPKKELWDVIIEVCGDDPDIDLMVEAQAEWARRGFSPMNFAWLFEWYASGKIPYKNNGKKSNTETLKGYREAFSS